MPPKKQQEALKKKIVEDKTFGLKNKNKSKKVQQYVHQVEQQAQQKVEGANRRRKGAGAGSSAADAQAQSKKALLAARLEELSLLNQPVAEKKKTADEEAEERRRKREEEEAERIRIANLPVEEQIEEERAKLTSHTPVTEALFLEWKARKDAERAKKEEASLAAAQKNKSKAERMRGVGLTGRQLFDQHKDIFVDDEEADNTKYERPDNDWIGDDADAVENSEPRDAGVAQNTADEEHEPPTLTEDDDGDAGVGDESLFT